MLTRATKLKLIEKTSDSPVSAVDLFCGAGGLTHGLIQAGIKVEAGIDIDKSAEYEYVTNNPGAKYLCWDVGAKYYPSIEKHKAARAEKLKNLLAEDKKDDGLVFDELGVDHVFIDEAHYFKNLETPPKMERVAGIRSGGSERAFDVYMKVRYLDEQHTGHGVTFATGTPISNTMAEMYTMQRFLDPHGLQARGIKHFDAWAATFGDVVDTMEISPDGAGLRPRSRLARFTNLPKLPQMFRAFSDVQTADMLDLPRPRLQGGESTTVACPMSDEQHELQQEQVERYERLRSQKLDPRVDNALAITTDGRKLATDACMLSATAPDFPESKVNRLVENVVATWNDTAATRDTQMIFADMGVNATPWESVMGKRNGWSNFSENSRPDGRIVKEYTLVQRAASLGSGTGERLAISNEKGN